uniref:Uncharacterized protein n=1 Tax=Populus alba TaxID=43335 RepID=A0A4V6AAT7_POPAL|nr:hypothetical protein D5086_0000090840 [Populus alba]
MKASLPPHNTNWYPDTGSINYLTSNFNNLSLQSDAYLGNDQIHVGDRATPPLRVPVWMVEDRRSGWWLEADRTEIGGCRSVDGAPGVAAVVGGLVEDLRPTGLFGDPVTAAGSLPGCCG